MLPTGDVTHHCGRRRGFPGPDCCPEYRLSGSPPLSAAPPPHATEARSELNGEQPRTESPSRRVMEVSS
ncbi:hypothetical protein EYF80_064511 [Liparis tanakae]|uniref:Uncharacterized protein n=1 Tax=Liparis tanakae TaxID=230148 RepID=A0A4Z2E9X6_9TELE|nr:hypothetical protein EYF80_064511 [Liparis tanakae]